VRHDIYHVRHRTLDIRQREGIREKESKVRDRKDGKRCKRARVCVHVGVRDTENVRDTNKRRRCQRACVCVCACVCMWVYETQRKRR